MTEAENRPTRRSGTVARLRAARHAIWIALQMVVVGLLAGAFVTTVATFVLRSVPLVGGSDEIPEARAFMVGLIEDDPLALFELQPRRNVLDRAIDVQGSGGRSEFEPVALRYLGGGAAAGNAVQIYAVEFEDDAAEKVVVSYSVLLVDGKVVLVR
jgi:hypothetical protein